MTVRVDFDLTPEGARITRLTTLDKIISVPGEVNGVTVTSIGPAFLAGIPGTGGRILCIPPTVTRMDPDALDGTRGIGEICYDGELETFITFGVNAPSNCTLRCRNHGNEYVFEFLANHPMSFPAFDDAMLKFHMGLTPEIAFKRLAEPVGLTVENKARYERFVSDRIMPKAEQAVASGNTDAVRELFSTGMISDEDLKKLLVRSLKSGRVSVTSMLMSEIKRRSDASSDHPDGDMRA